MIGISGNASRIVRVFVTVALFAFAFYYVDHRLFIGNFASLDAPFFSLISGLVLLNLAIIFFRLQNLFRFFQFEIHPWILYRAHVAGLVSGLFIFNIAGTIIGRNLELRHAGVSASAVAILSSVEKAVVMVVSVVFLAAGFLFLFGFDSLDEQQFLGNLWLFLTALGLSFLAAGYLLFSNTGMKSLLARMTNNNAAQSFKVITLSVASQTVMLAVYSGSVLYIDPSLDPFPVICASAIVSFSASLPISINGWGVRELASVFAFGLLGVSAPEALAISVAVGVCSTLLVVVSGLTLYLEPRRLAAMRADMRMRAKTIAAGMTQSVGGADQYLRLVAILLPFLCCVSLFFQLQLTIFGSAVTVNLADATALVALALVPSLIIAGARIPIRLPPAVVGWFVLISALLVFAFLLGTSRFGVTPWALNNRLTGWLILLGYVCVGAIFVGAWGRRAVRRFGEFLACAAVVTVLMSLVIFIARRYFDVLLIDESNFQGFSSNRNAYAFQLLVTLVFLVATARARMINATRPVLLTAVAIIILGILMTESKAAFLCLGLLFTAFALTRGLTRRNLIVVVLPAAGFALCSFLFMLVYDSQTGSFVFGQAFDRFLGTINLGAFVERWASIKDGLRLWLDYPLFGAGLGHYIHQQILLTGQPLVIHSTPVWILSEFGIVGMICLLVIPVAWSVRKVFGPERSGGRQSRILFLLIATLLVFGLVHEIFYQRIFWVGAGICLGGFAFSRRPAPGPLPKPVKILHVITSLNRGGAESMLLGLLRSRGPEVNPVVVSLLSDSVLTEDARATGTPVHELGFTSSRPSIVGFLKLVWLIRSEKPDVVQGWMYHGDLTALLALYLSGRRSRTRLIWGIRCSDMDLSKYSRALRAVVWLCARLSRWPDAVTANSRIGMQVHRQIGYVPKRFDVVPNGTDVERFKPAPELKKQVRRALGLPVDARIFAHVARVDPMKNHALLLRVAAAVPELHFVLVGKGTELLDTPANVTVLGQRGDVETILIAADALVSSSAYGEGFSNAVVEGMAAGLIPVGTDVGDTRRIIAETGWVVPPCDFEAMVAVVKQVLELDEADLVRYQAAARKRVVDSFTLAVAAESFNAVYSLAPGGSEPVRPGGDSVSVQSQGG